MFRRHSRPAGALLAIVAMLGLGACGSSDDDDSDGGSKAQAESAAVVIEGVELAPDPALRDALPSEIRDRGTVRVANDSPFPPYELFEGDDESKLTGFEPELGRAMAAVLGIEFEYMQQPFDGIIPALQARKYDLVMSAMTDTKERQQILDFVDHSRTGLTIVVRKGNPEGITTLLDLCGKSVAVQKGTTDEIFLESTQGKCTDAGKPKIDGQTYPKQSNAFLAVKSGKADANLVDGAVGGYAAKTVDGGAALEQIVDPEAPTGYESNPVGIGMLKGQDELRDAVEGALQAVMDRGVYEKLAKRWGMENTILEAPTVNAGT